MIGSADVENLTAAITVKAVECFKENVEQFLNYSFGDTDTYLDIYHLVFDLFKKTITEFLESRDLRENDVAEPDETGGITEILRKSVADPNILLEWCPVFLYDDGDCCVAGYLNINGEYRLYRTNIVNEVFEEGRVLCDRDNKYFRLGGEVCKKTYDKLAELEGTVAIHRFPGIFIKGFSHGIPKDWKRIIRETVEILKNRHNVANEFIPAVNESSSDSVGPPLTVSDHHSKASTADGTHTFDFTIVPGYGDSKVKKIDSAKKLFVKRIDHGGSLDLAKRLKRTRCGRLIKPPLDSWRGQSIVEANGRINVCLGHMSDQVYLRRIGVLPDKKDSGYRSMKKEGSRNKQKRKSLSHATARRLLFTDSDLDDTNGDFGRDLMNRASLTRTQPSGEQISITDDSESSFGKYLRYRRKKREPISPVVSPMSTIDCTAPSESDVDKRPSASPPPDIEVLPASDVTWPSASPDTSEGPVAPDSEAQTKPEGTSPTAPEEQATKALPSVTSRPVDSVQGISVNVDAQTINSVETSFSEAKQTISNVAYRHGHRHHSRRFKMSVCSPCFVMNVADPLTHLIEGSGDKVKTAFSEVNVSLGRKESTVICSLKHGVDDLLTSKENIKDEDVLRSTRSKSEDGKKDRQGQGRKKSSNFTCDTELCTRRSNRNINVDLDDSENDAV